jgi:hypothetical protein
MTLVETCFWFPAPSRVSLGKANAQGAGETACADRILWRVALKKLNALIA